MKNIANQSATRRPENTEVHLVSSSATPAKTREWGMRLALVGFALLWLSLMAVSWAQAADAPTANSVNSGNSANSDGEYNFTWLDPDKKIYVLQNRRYTKAEKVELSLMIGPGLSNPYRNTFNADPRLTYYFSEAFGLEAFYGFTFNTPNNTYQALVGSSRLQNVQPVLREIQNQIGLNLVWVPWYAKINVFNRILYFDWYFTAGVGSLHSQVAGAVGPSSANTNPVFVPQDNIAAFFGTGQNFNLSQNFLIRLDLSTSLYNAPIFGVSGDTSWYTNFNFGAGLGLKL